MGSCFCTGRCREGGACAAFPQGRPTIYPNERGTLTITHNTLSEEDVRRIVREELGKVGTNPRKIK
jgi:hypothetical protein